MFFIIIFTVFLVWFIFCNYQDGWFGSLFFGTVVGFLFTLFVGLFVHAFLPVTLQSYTVPIYSASLEDALRGSFVFGSGSIDSVDKYSTFIKSGNGKRKFTFDAADVTVIEKAGVVPHIVVQYEQPVNSWWTKFVAMTEPRNHKTIEMVVPEGSVTTQFNID